MDPVEVEIEIVEVDTNSVACDGGGGALGHPKVWVALDASGHGTCLYCGRRFVRRAGASAGDALGTATPDGVVPSDPTTTPPAQPQA